MSLYPGDSQTSTDMATLADGDVPAAAESDCNTFFFLSRVADDVVVSK